MHQHMSKKVALSTPPLPSNRKFGWFFAALFAMLATYAYWKSANIWAATALIVAIIFAVAGLIAPQVLAPLNRSWYGLGMLLSKIVSPIVLGIIFFVLITPISLITRILGRDELLLKKRNVNSYWVDRDPVGTKPDSFKNQF